MFKNPSITVQVRYKTDDEKARIFNNLTSLGWSCYGQMGIGTSGYCFEWKKDTDPIYPDPKDVNYTISKD